MKLIKKDLERMFYLYGIERNISLLLVILYSFHPRFCYITIYRAARLLFKCKIPIIPRILSIINVVVFNIEIALESDIKGGLFIPHSFGIVIGAGYIGENVTIYQGVTLGAKNLDIPFNKLNRPNIGSGVTIASGAVVLGGISVGDNVTIAANSVVLKDVESNVLVAGAPAIVKRHIGK